MTTTQKARDWRGKGIEEHEPDDKIVTVWKISRSDGSPVGNGQVDYFVEREYQQAVSIATNELEAVMDAADEDELRQNAVGVEVKLIQMRLGEYRDVIKGDA